jgi:hypothetical protein
LRQPQTFHWKTLSNFLLFPKIFERKKSYIHQAPTRAHLLASNKLIVAHPQASSIVPLPLASNTGPFLLFHHPLAFYTGSPLLTPHPQASSTLSIHISP